MQNAGKTFHMLTQCNNTVMVQACFRFIAELLAGALMALIFSISDKDCHTVCYGEDDSLMWLNVTLCDKKASLSPLLEMPTSIWTWYIKIKHVRTIFLFVMSLGFQFIVYRGKLIFLCFSPSSTEYDHLQRQWQLRTLQRRPSNQQELTDWLFLERHHL